MTEPGTDGSDEGLRALLARADPAASLPPLDPAGVDRRTEQAMQDDHTTIATGGTSRRRLVLVAASTLAVLVLAGALVVALLPGREPLRLDAAPGPGAGGPVIASACAPVTPESIAQRALAFEGIVVGVDGATVTLRVEETFRGDPTDEVLLPQQPDTGALPDEFSAGRLEPGARYLVAADADGRVALCGATGPATPELRAVYEAARS